MESVIITASVVFALLGVIFWVIAVMKMNRSKFEAERQLMEAEKERDKILADANLKAQDAAKNLKKELEKEHQQAIKQLRKKENEADKRFDMIDRKREKVEERESELTGLKKDIENSKLKIKEKEVALEKIIQKEQDDLSRIAGLDAEKAKEMLFDKMKNELDAESKTSLANHLNKLQDEAEEKSKKILLDVMQRLTHDVTTEVTTANVDLPKEELKGKIIGKEGRNIRTFEQVSGVDVIIDESPDYVVISCFDSYRREIARRAMEKLLKDGRIHPARIEEVIRETEDEIDEEVRKVGEQTVIEAGFTDIHPEIIKCFGRLKFRHSYGQNQIRHALQVMELCDYIATELKLDTKLARRCGLLHDIGKAVDQGTEGSHPDLGYNIASKYGENDIVSNAIAAHHEGVEVTSIYTTITAIADAISAARPGARKESTQKYFERMEKLENIAFSFKGVNKVYALRAGRELRVSVDAGAISEQDGVLLTRDIAKSIEQEATYPGEVKVTLMRETRYIEFAR